MDDNQHCGSISFEVVMLLVTIVLIGWIVLLTVLKADEAYTISQIGQTIKSGSLQRAVDVACQLKLYSRFVPIGSGDGDLLPYQNVYIDIYKTFGFRIAPSCETSPWLALLHVNQTKTEFCKDIFQTWKYENDKPAPDPPPFNFGSEFKDEFLLRDTINLQEQYYNHYSGDVEYEWKRDYVDSLVQRANNLESFGTYGPDTQSILKAAASVNMTEFKTAVIGSIDPWVESILLANGVLSILTAEYGLINSDHPNISYIHPKDLVVTYLAEMQKDDNQNKTFPLDLIASFSSLEHSGLGRYGDVVNPWSDVREMQKVWCLLKPGGIVLLGLPIGIDTVIFNAFRIYGAIRLPMMTAGFQVMSIYDNNDVLDLRSLDGDHWPMRGAGAETVNRYTIVLKKLSKD